MPDMKMAQDPEHSQFYYELSCVVCGRSDRPLCTMPGRRNGKITALFYACAVDCWESLKFQEVRLSEVENA